MKEDLRLGLLGPALARQLTRLPAGNQEAVLALTRRETLTAPEVSGVIDLLQGASAEQAAFVLAQPREALAQARGVPTALRDPRLSGAGNWLARHLTQALEALTRIEHWLRTPGERELTARDREIVQPLLARLGDRGEPGGGTGAGTGRGAGGEDRMNEALRHEIVQRHQAGHVATGHRPGPGRFAEGRAERVGPCAGPTRRTGAALAQAAPRQHHRRV